MSYLARNLCRTAPLFLLTMLWFVPLAAHAADADHLLFSEVVVLDRDFDTDSKYIEIYNPTEVEIDLSDIYITDATNSDAATGYHNIVTGQGAGGGSGSTDFHCRFPFGSAIAAGDTIVIALFGSDVYSTAYGHVPDFELYEDHYADPDSIPDMREAFPGGIGAGLGSNGLNSPDLRAEGETLVLYRWDGESDLVQDLDYIIWGSTLSVRLDKSDIEIDGPDTDNVTSTYADDTAVTAQQPIAGTFHYPSGSFRRLSADEGAEVLSGGNGFTGHDETSEDLPNTWESATDQHPPLAPATLFPPAPIVDSIGKSPVEPYLDYPVTVTANLLSYDTVSGVSLFYRVDGGSYTEVVGVSGAGWTMEIPGQSEGAVVDWYIIATGSGGGVTHYPVWAPIWTEQYTVGGPPAPDFTSVTVDPAAPFDSMPTNITISLESLMAVTGVSIFFRVDGGDYTEVVCTDLGDDVWNGEIPGQPEGAVVDWYMVATASSGGIAYYPTTAPDTPLTYTVTDVPTGPAHLLLTEVCVAGNPQEFIEIHNPMPYAVDLSNYYITDAIFNSGGQVYWNIVQPNPSQATVGGGDYTDFHARFPDGASIAAGDTITVSIPGSSSFLGAWGFKPNFELYEDEELEEAAADSVPEMLPVFPGSINGSADPTLSNSGEVVVLYYWDGESDLVTDIDIFLWGATWTPQTYHTFTKNGESRDGPDADAVATAYNPETVVVNQDPFPTTHSGGQSFQRIDPDEGSEIQIGGNGVGGNDELSENLSVTWDIDDGAPSGPPVKLGNELILYVPARTFLPRLGEEFPINIVSKSFNQTSLRIFDLEGRLVVTLYDSRFDGFASTSDSDPKDYPWDGRDSNYELVPAGMYVVHLSCVNPRTGELDVKTAPVVVATRLSR